MDIICGPIVRHTTRKEINLWFVSDKELGSVACKVYGVSDFSEEVASTVSNSIAEKRIKVANKCFFYMLTIPIALPDTLELVYYDILIDGNGFRESGFNTMICLDGEELPSIRVPIRHQHFIQASCRKPHAEGPKDQLSTAADVVQNTLLSDQRPSQLYLTGDQIYADDVSPIVLDYLGQLSGKLGFAKENITRRNHRAVKLDSTKLDQRDSILTDASGFTSDDRQSHLITVAEYLCMYLFSFAGLLQSDGQDLAALASYKGLRKRLRLQKATPNRKHRNGSREYTEDAYDRDYFHVNCFAEVGRGHTRRLLANISTYMMFDDHEVTDDWNLSKANYRKLSSTALGTHIYSNALTAYLICQHWGNQPGTVDKELHEAETLCLNPSSVSRKPSADGPLWERDWGYVLDQIPVAVVLDTRTGREYGKHGRNSLSLMSSDRIASVGNSLSALPACPSMILVSSTPMFGFSPVEKLQLKFPKVKYFSDREPWVAGQQALEALQSALSGLDGLQDVAVFSGDVHYAFARRQRLENTGITYWQLCSSASCNSPMGMEAGLKFIGKVGDFFEKENTKYLEPNNSTGDDNYMLTSDKNIGSLMLNDDLKPAEFIVHCRKGETDNDADGVTYTKTYNLENFVEVTGNE